MKCNNIYNEILNLCHHDLANNACLILRRLNLNNNTDYKIMYPSNDACTILLINNEMVCHLTVQKKRYYDFSFFNHDPSVARDIIDVDQKELLDFLEENQLIKNIRETIIENLEEQEPFDPRLLKHTRKIFEVLKDDFFDQRGTYNIYIRNPSLSSNIECRFNDFMLMIQSDGGYGLYKDNILNMEKEQDDQLLKFKKFVPVLSKMNLIREKVRGNKDEQIYILDFN